MVIIVDKPTDRYGNKLKLMCQTVISNLKIVCQTPTKGYFNNE